MQDDTSECGESFRDSQEMYGTSRFGEKFKRSWIRKLEKLKKNVWDRQICRRFAKLTEN